MGPSGDGQQGVDGWSPPRAEHLGNDSQGTPKEDRWRIRAQYWNNYDLITDNVDGDMRALHIGCPEGKLTTIQSMHWNHEEKDIAYTKQTFQEQHTQHMPGSNCGDMEVRKVHMIRYNEDAPSTGEKKELAFKPKQQEERDGDTVVFRFQTREDCAKTEWKDTGRNPGKQVRRWAAAIAPGQRPEMLDTFKFEAVPTQRGTIKGLMRCKRVAASVLLRRSSEQAVKMRRHVEPTRWENIHDDFNQRPTIDWVDQEKG